MSTAENTKSSDLEGKQIIEEIMKPKPRKKYFYQANKYDRNPAKQKFRVTRTPTKSLEIVHLKTFQAGGQKFLKVIEVFSKYEQATQ